MSGQIVGLIPARGGSKGILNKNIAECAGRPLIAWSCDAALASTRLLRTIVSTDSELIADAARAAGVEVPFIRPAALAQDRSSSLEVIVHALDWLESTGTDVRAIALLQPTSPLRTHAHIDDAVDLFLVSEAETLVSVVEVPHRFHPESLVEEREGWLSAYCGTEQSPKRRQDLPRLYARNGPAILICSVEVLRSGRLYRERTRAFPMSPEDSVDVDSPSDLEYASFLLRRRGDFLTGR